MPKRVACLRGRLPDMLPGRFRLLVNMSERVVLVLILEALALSFFEVFFCNQRVPVVILA